MPAPKLLLLSLLLFSNSYYAKIETLDDFDLIRSQYPKILEENIQKVVKITQQRTPEQEKKALYDSDDVRNFHSIIFIGPSLDYVLGGGIQDGWLRYNNKKILEARTIITVIGGANIVVANALLKKRYSYPRPFVVSDDINLVSSRTYNKAKVSAYRSFPSGHTAMGYLNALLLAQLIPERYPELMTAASDFGHSRILLGVHYPLDVIGSRMVVMSQIASLMSYPIFRSLVSIARREVRRPIELNCRMSIQDCERKNIPIKTELFNKIYDDEEKNRQRFNERMDYGFTRILDTNAPFIAPKNSGWLLFYRFPYLTNEQRLDIIRSTAAETGYPLDNQTNKGSWQRINLYEASLGPKRFDGTWVVDMNGKNQEKLISGWLNPYYQYDKWYNDMIGNGHLIKKGQGTLSLMGNNQLSGISVLKGGLILNGDNRLNALSEVNNGFLQVQGSLNSFHQLVIGQNGVLFGSGVINSPVYLKGILLTSDLAALTILKTLQFYSEAVYRPQSLGIRGALIAQGKQAHVIFNGTLDARNIMPGSLIDLHDGADLSGQFHTILQPIWLLREKFYYDVLLHNRGANLYVSSNYYPSVENFQGSEKEGAILLIRLQGSPNAMSNFSYQSWLNRALYTGDMQLLPKLIYAKIYADMFQYINQSFFSSDINPDIRQYEIGQSSIWTNYTANNINIKADEGHIATHVQDRKLSFGFDYLLNSRIVLVEYLALNQIQLKQFGSWAKVQQSTGMSGMRYYLHNDRQGFYIESGLGLKWYQFEVERQLGILGKDKGKKSGYSSFIYGKAGYYLLLDNNWNLEPNIIFQWQKTRHKAFSEAGSEFNTQFSKQSHISSRLKIGVDLARNISVTEDFNVWRFAPSIGIYDEINLKNHPSREKASLHHLEYDVIPSQSIKHNFLLNAGLKLYRKNNEMQLKTIYQNSKRSRGIGAEIRFNYQF